MIKRAFHKIIIAFCFLTLLSCGKDKEKETQPNTIETPEKENGEVELYDFSKFEIGKASLGPVKVGMTIKKAEEYLSDFKKQEAEAYDFGFDGGGKSYIYNYKGKPVLALLPYGESDSILAIVAIDKNLRTTKGLHPGMTAGALLPLYPNVKFHLNHMMEWEEVFDDVNGWTIVFSTDDKNRIGEYKDMNTPSLPKKLEVPGNWITIEKPVVKNDCTLLRDGVFKYTDADGQNVTVKINGESWTEEHKGGKYVTLGKLKWKGKCQYENMLVMSSLPGFKLPPGTVMNVTIDQVKGFDIYFTATAEGKSYHGKLTKM